MLHIIFMPKIILYAILKLDHVLNSLFRCIILKIIFKTLTAPWFWTRVPTFKPSCSPCKYGLIQSNP